MPIHQASWLEVIVGSMFSGKSEELIRRVKRAVIAKQNVVVFKPALDERYGVEKVATHNGTYIPCQPISDPLEILEKVTKDVQVVAVDEAQFLAKSLSGVCQELVKQNKRVIVAGLDLDFRGQPFGVMPELLALADQVTKLNAICVSCGRMASRTQRLIDGKPAGYAEPIILIGATENYEARCNRCHQVPGKPEGY